MSYKTFKGRTETYKKLANTLISLDQVFSRQPEQIDFYELEPAVVEDVILDTEHPIFKNKYAVVDENEWPPTSANSPHEKGDPDYSWIGRAKLRMIVSEEGVNRSVLNWAIPMETNIKEYPVINELVVVAKYLNNYYYTRKLNAKNFINHNADFRWERRYGLNDLFKPTPQVTNGIESQTSAVLKDDDHKGCLGKYFKANDKIRPLQPFEGDTIFESRHGSSIRFGCYVNDKTLDAGDPKNIDYTDGHGNPMVLIRNRQRPISRDKGSPESKLNGNILEDINKDGSSIQLTSGLTKSKYQIVCKKRQFTEGTEEQSKFSPSGCSDFKFPELIGDQSVWNSDRIIISSRNAETFHFSKKRYGVVTDDEYTVDAHKQIVMTSNTKTVFNSPFIYLGEYNQTKEPVLLGQTSAEWMYELCEVVSEIAKIIGGPTMVQVLKLKFLQAKIPKLLSKRVFVTGGGYAPGQDGGTVSGLSEPGKISSIPGDFFGDIPRMKGSSGGILEAKEGFLVGLGKPGGIGKV